MALTLVALSRSVTFHWSRVPEPSPKGDRFQREKPPVATAGSCPIVPQGPGPCPWPLSWEAIDAVVPRSISGRRGPTLGSWHPRRTPTSAGSGVRCRSSGTQVRRFPPRLCATIDFGATAEAIPVLKRLGGSPAGEPRRANGCRPATSTSTWWLGGGPGGLVAAAAPARRPAGRHGRHRQCPAHRAFRPTSTSG